MFRLTTKEMLLVDFVRAVTSVSILQAKEVVKSWGMTEDVAVSILENISNPKYVFKKGDMLFDGSATRSDYRITDAVWVLLSLLPITADTVGSIFKADAPAQICYEKNGKMYEIISIKDDEIKNLLMLEERIKSKSADGRMDYCSYVVVVPNESSLALLPDVEFPFVPCVLNYNSGYEEKPEVTFYARE